MPDVIALDKQALMEQIARIERTIAALHYSVLTTRAFGVGHNTQSSGALAYKLAKINMTLKTTREKLAGLMAATNAFLQATHDEFEKADDGAM